MAPRVGSHFEFLRNIKDNPAELSYRLIYADWLAENGLLAAERRQREYARLLQSATKIFSNGYAIIADKVYRLTDGGKVVFLKHFLEKQNKQRRKFRKIRPMTLPTWDSLMRTSYIN